MIRSTSFGAISNVRGDNRHVGRGRKPDLTPEEADRIRAEMRQLQKPKESNAAFGRRLGISGEWVGLILAGKGPSEAMARKVAKLSDRPDGFWRNSEPDVGVTKSATERERVRWIAARLALPEAIVLKLWARSAVRLADGSPGEDGMSVLPDVVRDAALAVVHLEDCTIEQAMGAASLALAELGPKVDWVARHWLDEVRDRVLKGKRGGSGTRPSARFKLPPDKGSGGAKK